MLLSSGICGLKSLASFSCSSKLGSEFRPSLLHLRISRFVFRVSIFLIAKLGFLAGLVFQPLTSSLQLPDFPGGLTARVTPVPIPNTEVKPCRADDTALETARERRSPPGLNFKGRSGLPERPFLRSEGTLKCPVVTLQNG